LEDDEFVDADMHLNVLPLNGGLPFVSEWRLAGRGSGKAWTSKMGWRLAESSSQICGAFADPRDRDLKFDLSPGQTRLQSVLHL